MPLPLAVFPLPPVSASLASEAGLAKARCRVWLGVGAPRSAPPYVSVGWEGPPPSRSGGVRTFSCGSAMPFAWGTRVRCQSCCVFAPCSVDGTVQLGECEHGHRQSPLVCNYWGEVLKVLSLESCRVLVVL